MLGMAHLLHPAEAAKSSLDDSKSSKTTERIGYVMRRGVPEDGASLLTLYKKVARIPGGLARTVDEITPEYIDKVVRSATGRGLMLVVQHKDALIASMAKYRLEPKTFSHVLTEGSILVDPEYQGKGIGTDLISTFLKTVENDYPSILRVELMVRESNPAIKLYRRCGFKEEGRLEGRICGLTEKLEADIPMVWINPKFKGISIS